MSTKSKVAIIEDDPAIIQMYKLKFETEGYEVKTAGDGMAGLELIEAFEPDAVLLELMMTNMNGMEMLSKLRSMAGGRDVKVIGLTNMGDNETATKVYRMAADDYIVKADMTPLQVGARVRGLMGAE